MVNDFDYWSKEQYFPICQSCKQRYNTNTRWCSRSCWVKQRKNYKDNYNDIFDEVFKEHEKQTYKYDKQCYFSNNDPLIEYWKILKLIPPKNKSEIKKQYYKLSLKYHPDKGGDNDKFIKLKNAYDKLLL